MIDCRCPECKKVCKIYGSGKGREKKESRTVFAYYLLNCKEHGAFTVTEKIESGNLQVPEKRNLEYYD